jgi:6-phosphogluconolactonase
MHPMNTSRITIGLLLVLFLLAGTLAAQGAEPALNSPPTEDVSNATLVYVGTYTGGKSQSKGIYLFRLKTDGLEVSQNITLVPLGLAAESPSPSFVVPDLKRRLVFAVNEIDSFNGQKSGSVSSFSIDPRTGKLTQLSQVSSKGTGPCHLVLDKEGKNVLVANYNSGSVAVLPVAPDGKLGEATAVVQHEGKSINPQRQEGPHAHCVTLDPSNKYAYVCDLGLDKVMIYRFDSAKGMLATNDPPSVSLKPGAGPRHMVFRPDGKFAYVLNELNSTVTPFAFDPETGGLKELESVTTLPGYYDGPNTAAEIAVHPSGKFLYASNRGNETVVLFEIDKDKGTLNWVEEQNTGGKTPRNFGIQPSAKHMAICNQNSDTVLASRIDPGNGRLKPSGVFAKCPSPVCAVFVPPVGGEKDKPMVGD